jgi:hypothetical protein
MTMPIRRSRRRRGAGQALVEFCLVLPIILTLVLSVAEVGVAIGTNMSLVLATREGARVGAALVNGGGAYGCGSGQSPNEAVVDPMIVASVQRALTSEGSGIDISKVDWIHIYKATASGGESLVNEWTPGAGPVVDGLTLVFSPGGVSWPACSRAHTLPADSLGVSISYRHQLFTPLSAFTGALGLTEIVMTDRTVMALEPGN